MTGEFQRPKVSVRIPSYNHEKYIRECMESLLKQSFQDFEIMITDDGSTDRTAVIIREFSDPRIKLEIFSENQGSAAAIANCTQRSQGDYLANLWSDDLWEKDKLEKQVRFLDDHPEYAAVFSKVQFIDDDSKEINDDNNVFDVANRSAEEWLNYFFYHGNCLCNPSVMIRKNVYEELVGQDKRLAGMGDFDLWVRLCLKSEIHIIDTKLTRFRLRAKQANASGNRLENHIRCHFEQKQILNNFLAIDDVERLLKIFPECEKYGRLAPKLIPYFLGRLAWDTGEDNKQLWGLEIIFNLMADESTARLLQQNCSFSYVNLHQLAMLTDPYKLKLLDSIAGKLLKLYWKIMG